MRSPVHIKPKNPAKVETLDNNFNNYPFSYHFLVEKRKKHTQTRIVYAFI